MYKGGCFLPGPEGKREIGELVFKPLGLTLELANSQSFSLPYKSLSLKVGGAGEQIVFFRDKEGQEEGLVLYSKELSILNDPFWEKNLDCEGAREQIQNFHTEKKK